MRVTCHRCAGSHAETLRTEWLPLKQSDLLRRWLGVASGPHFPSGGFAPSAKFHTLSPQITHAAHAFCAIFIINGNEVKWIVWRHVFIAEWLPLSGSTRSAARKRNAGYRLVCTNKGNAGRKAICSLHQAYTSHILRHIELLLCTRYLSEIQIFFATWPVYRRNGESGSRLRKFDRAERKKSSRDRSKIKSRKSFALRRRVKWPNYYKDLVEH